MSRNYGSAPGRVRQLEGDEIIPASATLDRYGSAWTPRVLAVKDDFSLRQG